MYFQINPVKLINGSMAELVDAPDSNSGHFEYVGIINTKCTTKKYS